MRIHISFSKSDIYILHTLPSKNDGKTNGVRKNLIIMNLLRNRISSSQDLISRGEGGRDSTSFAADKEDQTI